MDTAPLFTWLGLPPGPWPPDPHTLLAVPRSADAATLTAAAQARIDALRPYQLRHPELVTEGMNRIAQALVVASAQGPQVSPEPQPKALRTGKPKKSPNQARKTKPAPRATSPLFLPHSPLPTPHSSLPTPHSPLRQAVRYRRLARAWAELAPFLAEPQRPLDQPIVVGDLALALANVGRALRWVPVPLTAPGGLVAQFARGPLGAEMLRGLLPAQRQRVSADWHAGAAAWAWLAREWQARAELARPWRQRLVRAWLWAWTDRPEALALVLALAALTVAGARQWWYWRN